MRYALNYAYGFTAIVGVAMAASWLFAVNDEVYGWLGENRSLTAGFVILSIAIYALYIGLDKEARRARANAARMNGRGR